MFRRIAIRTLLALCVLLAVVVAGALSWRAYRQHVIAEATAIRSRDGIVEGRYVKIGGIDQWIQIRGWSRSNPVLLCIHGGPGGTWLPLTPLFSEWEKHFTVVMWDQRGAGRTLESTGPDIAATMSVERMTRDGIEVAEFLRSHLGVEKVLILGHSWGSLLGIRMIAQRPGLFSAYVGTGQVADMPRAISMDYARLLQIAGERHDDEALAELRAAGPPPFSSMQQVGHFFSVLNRYDSDAPALPSVLGTALVAPHISLYDLYERQLGFTRVPGWSIYNEMLSASLVSTKDLAVPVFFLQGANDDVTPAALVTGYFNDIRAPHKEMVLLPDAGHYAVWILRERFLRELIARVLPRISVKPGSGD
jgi:pimeloyl-ACP methyl ester carboxylesterase